MAELWSRQALSSEEVERRVRTVIGWSFESSSTALGVRRGLMAGRLGPAAPQLPHRPCHRYRAGQVLRDPTDMPWGERISSVLDPEGNR